MSISFKASPTPGPLGQHVISEFYGANNLFDPEPVKQVFREAAEAAGATLLGFDMRDFGEGAGFTGVAILAESHISIHTWPEYDYAAIDIFMCGRARPQDGLAVMARYFTPERQETSVIPRGLVEQIHAAVPGT